MTDDLTSVEAAVFGCFGGLLTYLVAFALPEIKGRWEERKKNGSRLPRPDLESILIIAFWLVVQLAISGMAAYVFQEAHTSVETAAITGMAANGLVAGYARSD